VFKIGKVALDLGEEDLGFSLELDGITQQLDLVDGKLEMLVQKHCRLLFNLPDGGAHNHLAVAFERLSDHLANDVNMDKINTLGGVKSGVFWAREIPRRTQARDFESRLRASEVWMEGPRLSLNSRKRRDSCSVMLSSASLRISSTIVSACLVQVPNSS